MAFKILVGRQEKGGSTQQQSECVENAVRDLESQLNDVSIGVRSVQGIFVHDVNPLHTEVIAVVSVDDVKPSGKGR